jgi:nicotinamide mononucleotide adenylyltransferase
MIVELLGKAGAGKTTIAEAMEKITPDSFIIDGDDLRAETENTDISLRGREANIHLGYSRARWLSDMGFTVFIAMQAPIKEIRDQYLNENDIEVVINNSGPNPKDDLGYNKNFNADYSGANYHIEFMDFDENEFWNLIFKKVLVIARFQGMHRGHKIVLESAKRISPNITIGLRVDKGDILDLAGNIKLLQDMGFNVIETPNIDDDNSIWEEFVEKYDTVVQGNPMVISKFQKSIDTLRVKLLHIPRIGHISATKIRNAIKQGDDDFARQYVNKEVLEFLKEEISK